MTEPEALDAIRKLNDACNSSTPGTFYLPHGMNAGFRRLPVEDLAAIRKELYRLLSREALAAGKTVDYIVEWNEGAGGWCIYGKTADRIKFYHAGPFESHAHAVSEQARLITMAGARPSQQKQEAT